MAIEYFTHIQASCMVTSDEASLIFENWASEGTPLLFRGQSPLYTHSLLGMVETAASGDVRVRLQCLGHIDIHISPDLVFEYFDPATQRNTTIQGLDMRSWAEAPATGAGVIATTRAGDSFTFLEILLA